MEVTLKIGIKYALLIAVLFGNLLNVQGQTLTPANFVDPFICTSDDHGQTDVAAGVPFGMVKPCPDTNPMGQSGYNYSSTEIRGFSQTRIAGVGCTGVGGNLRMLPFLFAGDNKIPHQEKYLKSTEQAVPGYYSVKFENQIQAEMTGSRQVAYYRFTFPKSDKAGISIDLTSSLAGKGAETHHLEKDGILSGRVSGATVCGKGYYSFFYAIAVVKSGVNTTKNGYNFVFQFSTDDQQVVPVYCALSVVSEENAIQTLKKSMANSFDHVKNEAFKLWNDRLNVVDVETPNDTLKRIFYTHSYHALQSPFIINDEDGSYRGSDGQLYQSDQPHFFGWSIWDTFRTKLPLFSLLYPEAYSQMMLSLKHLYLEGKPQWATLTEPFPTVRTEHAIIALLEAQRKGLLPFSLGEIYSELRNEMADLPFDSPDEVLESSYDLWAMSQIAADLDSIHDQRLYQRQAMHYRKTWRKYFKRMDRRADIMHARGLYEGTLWQYRWFVPFDIEGVQKMMGGKTKYEKQLDYFFNHELFNIGNQPDIQVPYLYAYSDSAWKTQQLVHRLLTEPTNNWYGTHEKWKRPETRKIFTDTPDGYISEMDDDAGTMSSWYVWSAIGLYPIFPGDTKMVISTPLFEKTTIALPKGKLIIKTNGLSSKNKYIQSILFNGVNWNSIFIDFNDLKNGGLLELNMGHKPVVFLDKIDQIQPRNL